MTISDDLPFIVSAHAIEQFQNRIAPMSDAKVRGTVHLEQRSRQAVARHPDVLPPAYLHEPHRVGGNGCH